MGSAKDAMNNLNNAERQAQMIVHQKAFVDNYLTEGTVGKTLKAIGLSSRGHFYQWLKNPEFNAIYQELKSDREDYLVSRLYKFIKGELEDGEKIVLNQQQLLAAFFLLKAFNPKVYSDKMQLQHTGADGAPVKVTTVEVHRAEKPSDTKVTAEDMKETIPDGNTDTPEI